MGVKVKIDDIEVEVPPGTNMIEAAKVAGVDIPHYCYHPNLSIAGNCRMCLVEVVGGRAPEIACNMGAREGLAIRTDTPVVKKMRKSVMEFLLVNHPLDCPICDQSGECKLQDYYMDHGRYDSRGFEPKVGKEKRQEIGDLVVLDAERCVHCSRCVRFSEEVTGTGELAIFNRTNHTEISVFPGTHITHNYQGNLADICPVGALTNKDFRFQRRVWYLRETDSVCTACATGCNIRVCSQKEEVFRYLPRRNDAVNKSWMCDQGRRTYHGITSLDRILRASVDGVKAEPDAAIAAIGARLKAAGAESVGFVLGTKATNEANWALLQLARANFPGARIFRVEGNEPGATDAHDEILLSADKNPNTAGVRLLATHDGNVGDRDALLAAAPLLKLLVVLEDDVVGKLGEAVGLPAIAYLGTHLNATARKAAIVVPTAHPVEQDGSYVNRQDRVQRVRRALAPAGDSAPAYALLDKLGAALGKAPGTAMVTSTFNAMARTVARMKGMDFKGLGQAGLALMPEAAPAPAVSPQATP